jgi:hypothetical protein
LGAFALSLIILAEVQKAEDLGKYNLSVQQDHHQEEVRKLNALLRTAVDTATSQPSNTRALGAFNFQLLDDPPAWRLVNAVCRAMGLESPNEVKDGENLLHKMCKAASPPWSNEHMVEAIRQLLLIRHQTTIGLDDPIRAPSNCKWRTAVDICCENKCPIGVKPAILLELLKARANPNQINSNYKPPIFYAAGTANIHCAKLLVSYGARLHIKYEDMNLAPYYSYLFAVPYTFHFFFGGKPEYHLIVVKPRSYNGVASVPWLFSPSVLPHCFASFNSCLWLQWGF